MIKKLFLISIFTFYLFANIELDKKEKKDILSLKKHIYTIQLYSSFKLNPAKRFLLNISKNLNNSFIIKSGKYYTIRYGKFNNINEAKKNLKKIKKYGFKDSFIVKMKRERLLKINHVSYNKKRKKINISSLILKANRYFEEGKYQKSLNSYLKLYKNGIKSDKILINISYLFGRVADFKEFENFLIDKEDKESLLYAFGIGAIEIDEDDIIKDILIKYLNYSFEGYIELLLGYIYEKQKDFKNAANFYKKAYLKNSKNPYFIYAYARSLDFLKDYKKATIYYKKILLISDNRLKKVVKNRLKDLKVYR